MGTRSRSATCSLRSTKGCVRHSHGGSFKVLPGSRGESFSFSNSLCHSLCQSFRGPLCTLFMNTRRPSATCSLRSTKGCVRHSHGGSFKVLPGSRGESFSFSHSLCHSLCHSFRCSFSNLFMNTRSPSATCSLRRTKGCVRHSHGGSFKVLSGSRGESFSFSNSLCNSLCHSFRGPLCTLFMNTRSPSATCSLRGTKGCVIHSHGGSFKILPGSRGESFSFSHSLCQSFRCSFSSLFINTR